MAGARSSMVGLAALTALLAYGSAAAAEQQDWAGPRRESAVPKLAIREGGESSRGARLGRRAADAAPAAEVAAAPAKAAAAAPSPVSAAATTAPSAGLTAPPSVAPPVATIAPGLGLSQNAPEQAPTIGVLGPGKSSGPSPAATPEPSTLLLMATGLAGLARLRRRRE